MKEEIDVVEHRRWSWIPGFAGFTCRSKAVVFAAFCSSAVSRARLAVNVSAIRNSITPPGTPSSLRRRGG